MSQRISKIIIVYELFNREYDNALLLKVFFEKKGFEVSIIYKLDLVSLQYSKEPKIVFIPNCYNSDNFDWYYHILNGPKYLLFDLQYEQSLSNDTHNIEFHIPKGKAKDIVHLCWGERYRSILLGHGIDPQNAYVSGAIHLDFLRPGFEEYWENRDLLANQHDIPIQKKWNLYISSFSAAENPISKNGIATDLGNEYAEYFSNFSTESRKETIQWFKDILKIEDDNIYIYRKHPAEILSQDIFKLRETYPKKFFVIDSYNIKQWIIISDRVFTWYSTAVVECYASMKPFHILRPVTIDNKYEVQMYEGGHFITNFNDFERVLHSSKKTDYPINVERINEAYKLSGDFAVINIMNLVLSDRNYIYFEEEALFRQIRRRMVQSGHLLAKYRIKHIYRKIYQLKLFRIRSQKIRSHYAIDEWEREIPVEEINRKIAKLSMITDKILI